MSVVKKSMLINAPTATVYHMIGGMPVVTLKMRFRRSWEKSLN